MSFYVTLDFKRGPSLGLAVEASTEEEAIEMAKRLAPQLGFTDPVTKDAARPA